MTTVYGHIAADGELLYIGRTSNLAKRTPYHRRSPWWPRVAEVMVLEDGLTHDRARVVERRLIEFYDPPNNYVFTPRWREAMRPEWARP